jgi:hypothetical protein
MTDPPSKDPQIGNSAQQDATTIRRLETERPVPAAAFRGELRRHLLSRGPAAAGPAPRRLRVLITTYAGSGLALLAVATLGLAGVGPFGA